jgi:hypothetical protein
MQITQELVAEKFLWGLWRCINDEYKEKYKKECWEHFENAIKSASYTGSMKVFLSNFQKRMPINLQVQYAQDILNIVDSGHDDVILNWLRSESTYLTLIVRIKNQDKKEAFKEAKMLDKEIETIGNLTLSDGGEVIEK